MGIRSRRNGPNSPTSEKPLGEVSTTKSGVKKIKSRLTNKPRVPATVGKYESIIRFFKCRNITTLTLQDDCKEYRCATKTNNLVYRFQQADCVVQPINASQVQTIVKHAKANGARLTIKNGGHSYTGSSTAKEGILLDLSKMRNAELDFERRSLTIQSGAVWGNAIRALIDSDPGDKHDGFILNSGRCLNVGVAGFLLGGGIGPFTRSFGMGCDSVEEIEIVTADGELVKVDNSEAKLGADKGKLFWALRGAGQGSFGVVTSIKVKIHQLKSKMVVHGRFEWTPRPGEDILQIMTSFYATKWSKEMTIDTTWLCDLQEPAQRPTTATGVRFLFYYNGTHANFIKEIKKRIANVELAELFIRRSKYNASSQWSFEGVNAQWKEEIRRTLPSNNTWQLYSGFSLENKAAHMRDLSTAIVELLDEYRQKFRGEKSSTVNVTLIRSGGPQEKEKGKSATAFPWRKAVYHAYVMIEYTDDYLHDEMRELSDRFRARLRPFSMDNGSAAFVNFPDELIAHTHHEKAYYSSFNATMLQNVKQRWDPDDFFHWDQSIGLPIPPGNLSEIVDDTDPDDKRMWSGHVSRNDREAEEWKRFRLPPG